MQRRAFNKALAATGALAALSPFNIVRAQAQKLKVGVILPRSGYLGQIGQSCQKGAERMRRAQADRAVGTPLDQHVGRAESEAARGAIHDAAV